MANKIVTLTELTTVCNTIKTYISSLISKLQETMTAAIGKVEAKINKITDTGTGDTYTLAMENGLLYLDDGKE